MTILNLQVQYYGKSPIQGGGANRKRITTLQLGQLMYAMNHGSRYKTGEQYIQYQTGVVAASATATCATVVSGNTLTIAGTALTAAQKRATGTVTCATVLAAQTFTISGTTFTGAAGAAVPGEATFSVDTGDNATAASIVAQVNAYGGPLVAGIVKARAASAVVTFYAVTQGTSGNAIPLSSSDGGTLAVSGANLANGAALSNNTFDFAGTDATTADALAAAINASTTAAVAQVTAVSDGVDVVTITSKVAGTAGNAITLTSSGATLAVTGSGFLADGAADAAVRMYF